jgi:hypothetical protein
MSDASFALLKSPGLVQSANPRMMARATYLFVVQLEDAKPHARELMSTTDMVARLRDGGLPIASLADILDVERKTVYAWLNGTAPRGGNISRIDTLYELLGDGRVDLRSLHRLWNRRLEHGYSIRDLLSAKDLSVPAIEDALQMLARSLEWHSRRETSSRASRNTLNIPLLDEIPPAGSRN